jgi:hypothetical protein
MQVHPGAASAVDPDRSHLELGSDPKSGLTTPFMGKANSLHRRSLIDWRQDQKANLQPYLIQSWSRSSRSLTG